MEWVLERAMKEGEEIVYERKGGPITFENSLFCSLLFIPSSVRFIPLFVSILPPTARSVSWGAK